MIRLLKIFFYILMLPVVLISMYLLLQVVLQYWKMDAELATLGDFREQLAWLQEDAVKRSLVRLGSVVGVFLLTAGLLWRLFGWYGRRPAHAPVPVVLAPPHVVVQPTSSKRWFTYVMYIVVLLLGYNTVRGYMDYRRASTELTAIVPFYEKRLVAFQKASDEEQAAAEAWKKLNDDYWLVLAKDEGEAKKMVPEVVKSMRGLAAARRARETEESVVTKVKLDVDLYKRVARQACPWRIVSDFSQQ